MAKRSERQYLTPLTEVSSLTELNEHLLISCQRDLKMTGPKAHTDRTREQLLEEERLCLREIHGQPYEACQRIDTTIDKRSLVTVDTNAYSAPVRWAHHPVQIKLLVDHVELWCEQQCVARHDRCFKRDQFILEPVHYLNLLRTKKPGSLDNARPFKGVFGPTGGWGEDFDLLRRELEYRYHGEGTKKFIAVLLLFTEYEEDLVRQAVPRCVSRRAFSDEAVLGELLHEPVVPMRRLDLSHRPDLVMVSDGIRPAALYDRLCLVEQEVA